MKLTNRTKRAIEADFKKRYESEGGKFIGTNWKKRIFHFVTPTGKRMSMRIAIA